MLPETSFFACCANKIMKKLFSQCAFLFVFGLAGKKCVVYDAVFHPDTYKKGQEV